MKKTIWKWKKHLGLEKIMSNRKKMTKVFNDVVIHKAQYDYNTSKNIGKLIVEFQSGIQYHYKNVEIISVKALFEHDEQYAFTAHNKYIDSRYRDRKTVYTQKWKDTIEEERRKQYLAKNNAARRARKAKSKQEKELVNA